jgi:hypothetical protein
MRYFVFFTLILLTISCNKTNSYQIEGIVTSKDDLKPLQNAKVSLWLGGGPEDETFTDINGHYRLEYTLTYTEKCPSLTINVEKDGYLTINEWNDILCIEDLQTRDFMMECVCN